NAILYLPFLLLPLLFFIYRYFKLSLASNSLPIPPAPKPWPIIRNLFQTGKMPHVTLALCAKSYGPLISLRFRTQIMILGSSREAAMEILKTHDHKLSAPFVPHILPVERSQLNNMSIGWISEYNGGRPSLFQTQHWNLKHGLLPADTGTSTATVELTMTELIRIPECISWIVEEPSRKIHNHITLDGDLSQLSYLQACGKESLRLHPPTPLLQHHQSKHFWFVVVSINIWSIGRNPAYWEDPLSLRPERFMNSKLDYLGNDFRYIPFSSGKRICPGMPMASKQIQLLLANLIYFLDWSLPRGKKLTVLDMIKKSQFLLHKNEPPCVIPKARN
ncbi:Cytochrome P450, partial [Dillenia turbinata]